MSLRNRSAQYGRVAQGFHWLSSLLILLMWPMGVIMTRIPEAAATRLYRAHTGLGMAVLILTVLRLIWFFYEEQPDHVGDIAVWRKQAFIWNHRLLYIGLLLLTVSGISMLLASGIFPPSPANVTPEAIIDARPRQAHAFMSKLFIALLVMHVAGVVNYQMTKGNTFRRMGVPIGNPNRS